MDSSITSNRRIDQSKKQLVEVLGALGEMLAEYIESHCLAIHRALEAKGKAHDLPGTIAVKVVAVLLRMAENPHKKLDRRDLCRAINVQVVSTGSIVPHVEASISLGQDLFKHISGRSKKRRKGVSCYQLHDTIVELLGKQSASGNMHTNPLSSDKTSLGKEHEDPREKEGQLIMNRQAAKLLLETMPRTDKPLTLVVTD